MFPEERKQKICDIVNESGSAKVTELSQLMNISEVTIRRDLEELDQQKKLVRTHGGAIAMYSVGSEISAPELILSNKNVEEKRSIAALAYSLICDKDTIFADGSSTVHELIKLIAAGEKQDLLIIATSIVTVNALSECKNVKVIMLGGEINYRHNHVEGALTTKAIRSLRADKCFIGINGIDETFGYSTPRFPEAEQKAEMINASIQSFILADESKFGKVYLAKVDANCDFIITNSRNPDYAYDALAEKCRVLFADDWPKDERLTLKRCED